MKLLSLLMVTKKRANSTYCVLLSATPHSGNLDKMFRLWYFVRCKGGNPDDFDVKDDKDRTIDYKKKKNTIDSMFAAEQIQCLNLLRQSSSLR